MSADAVPFFSIVIPVFNRAAMLEECLASVFAQQFREFEVIVVDDGSTDGTREVLKRHDGAIHVLSQRQRGPAAARNAGIRAASGRYVAFLDCDDLFFPWSLQTYSDVAASQGSPAFIAGRPERFPDGQRPQAHAAPPAVKAFADYLASGDEWRWWGASSFVIRTDALRSVGGFTDEWINGEDADLALRLGASGAFVQVCAPATFGYREHGGNETGNFNRTLAGAWHAVRMEQAERYPGGRTRSFERRRILTRHLRPVMIECLRSARRSDAWRMYRATFGWHVQQGRWRFLAAFPFMAMFRGA